LSKRSFYRKFIYKKAESDKIVEDKNVGESGPMKVPGLYFSISRDRERDSSNKSFANYQNLVFIEN